MCFNCRAYQVAFCEHIMERNKRQQQQQSNSMSAAATAASPVCDAPGFLAGAPGASESSATWCGCEWSLELPFEQACCVPHYVTHLAAPAIPILLESHQLSSPRAPFLDLGAYAMLSLLYHITTAICLAHLGHLTLKTNITSVRYHRNPLRLPSMRWMWQQGRSQGGKGEIPPSPNRKNCCRKMVLFPKAVFLVTNFPK